MRETAHINNEYYHVFNRGVDKRQVFMDSADFRRFLKCMIEFNTPEPIGHLNNEPDTFKDRQLRPLGTQLEKLVNIIAYCINPNHFHFILRQNMDGGMAKFMQKVGAGYTKYFNKRYERNGALFQGPFKSVHIENNEQLLYVSAYVNLNNHVHKSSHENLPVCSSWGEYTIRGSAGICEKNIILSQFKDISAYEKFAKETVVGIRKQRELGDEGHLDTTPLGDILMYI